MVFFKTTNRIFLLKGVLHRMLTLKRIIARQALELEVKGELLKKTPVQPRKR